MNALHILFLAIALLIPSISFAAENDFAPPASEFVVTFSKTPTVTEFETVTTDGDTIKGKRAEVRNPDGFERAEVIPMARGFSKTETKESAISKAKQYAVHNGLTAPEFTWEVTSLGKRLTMRGTKILEDQGKQKSVTFQTIFYYGDSTLLALYVGAESSRFPTSRISKFLASVKKKTQ